jgi:hypothetical protein
VRLPTSAPTDIMASRRSAVRIPISSAGQSRWVAALTLRQVVGTDDRRGRVAAAARARQRDGSRRGARGTGRPLAGDRGNRGGREAGARIDGVADERVNLAERQRERGADQPLMRSVHKSEQRQVEPVGHGYDERHLHSSHGTRWRRAPVGRQASTPFQRQCLRSAHKPWIPRTLNA